MFSHLILATDMRIKYYILNAKMNKLKPTQGCPNRSLPRQEYKQCLFPKPMSFLLFQAIHTTMYCSIFSTLNDSLSFYESG